MRRKVIREKVLQALYAHELSQDPIEHVFEHVLTGLKKKSAHQFARRLALLTLEHQEEIDRTIMERTQNWDSSRLAIIDHLILRIAVCEMLHFPEIPPKVTMDEAIELAKLFSTENSGLFINGILNAILAGMRAAGPLPKTGRGLIENSRPEKAAPRKSSAP